MGDLADLSLDLVAGLPGLAAGGKVAASSPSCLVALASVVPSKPRAWAACISGEWVKMVRRSVP